MSNLEERSEVSYDCFVELERADILVTNRDILKKTPEERRALSGAEQIQVVSVEGARVPFPIGNDTTLRRMEIAMVMGLESAI